MKVLPFLMILLLSSCAHNPEDDQKAITKTFYSYKNAIAKSDGMEAMKYMDSNTINYFSAIINHILHSDSTTIEGLPLIDKFTVLLMRHLVPTERLKGFNTDSLINYTVTSGFAGGKNVGEYSLGQIKIDGDKAVAPVMQDTSAIGTDFHFHLEQNEWKIDISPAATGAEKVIADQIKPTGKSDHDYIIDILGVMTGNPASSTIWHKLD